MYKIQLTNGETLILKCKVSIVSSGTLNLLSSEGKPKLLASYSAGTWKTVELVDLDDLIEGE